MIERTLAVSTHGRFLVEPQTSGSPGPLLVGFHGYAEGADAALARLRSIPGAERWTLIAIQGLNRFYRGRSSDVVASWMTSQDREHVIADNKVYVRTVVDLAAREWNGDGRVAFAGFSQGVAMAFRAAADGEARRVIAVGGDVPPELDSTALARIPAVLIGRGTRDALYGESVFEADVRRLRAAGTRVDAVDFDAEHAWTDEVSRAAGVFLSGWR